MILKTAPKHLWSGKSRLAKRQLSCRKILNWALTVKPGDYIGSCVGYNVKVDKIIYLWENEGEFRRLKKNKTWFLWEVEFTDVTGKTHICPGGGCVLPPQTPEEVSKYLIAYSKDRVENPSTWTNSVDFKIYEAAKSGNRIVDEFGTLLPEFLK